MPGFGERGGDRLRAGRLRRLFLLDRGQRRDRLPHIFAKERRVLAPLRQAQRIEGAVTLDVVVNADGGVSDVKVAKSLDNVFGLDKAAVKAMKEWTFKPGMKDGKAVAVQVTTLMTFTLK